MCDINIAFCCDDRYIIPASIMIKSFLDTNKKKKITVFTFGNDLNEKSITELKNIVEKYGANLVLLSVPLEALEIIKKAPIAWEYLSLTTYYRLILPYVVDEDIENILYLDCDMLVRKDVTEYLHEIKENYFILGANDIEAEEHQKRLRVDKYINAGALFMNVKKIREKYSMSEMLYSMNDLMDKYDLICGDQDMINILFQNEIKILPDIFNYQHLVHKMYVLRHKQETKNVQIAHFITGDKPWKNGYCFPYAREYYSYLKKYLNTSEKIIWWLAKVKGVIEIIEKHIKWKKGVKEVGM